MTHFIVAEVSTPQSIKDEDNIDVFAVALSDYQARAYYTQLYNAFWYTYRHRMIGTSCDDEIWEVQLYDRVKKTMLEFDPYLVKLTSQGFDVTDGISDGNKLTETITDDDTKHTPGVTHSHHYEDEDLPQNATGNTKYLSKRGDTTDSDTGYDLTEHDSTRVAVLEGTRTDAESLNAALEQRLTRVYDEIVHRVSDLFLNRWF